jgi:hypothetical protein
MNLDNIYIHQGGSETIDGKPCVMNLVHAAWLIEQHGSITQALIDQPACTETVIAKIAITVNDQLADEERQRLRPLIPRLYMAHRVADDEARERVLIRVACWAARSVLHLTRPEDRGVCEQAIETAERWLSGEASEQECSDATATARVATAAAYAAHAAHAHPYRAADATTCAATCAANAADSCCAAAYACAAAEPDNAYPHAANTASAAAYAYATYAAYSNPNVDLVAWLSEVLDQYDKARADEGVLHEEFAEQVGGF